MRKRIDLVGCIVVLYVVLAVYITVSSIAFQFRHPELTETQRLLRFWDAMMWR